MCKFVKNTKKTAKKIVKFAQNKNTGYLCLDNLDMVLIWYIYNI